MKCDRDSDCGTGNRCVQPYVQDPPADQDQLHLVGANRPPKVKSNVDVDLADVPFYRADSSTAPTCTATQP